MNDDKLQSELGATGPRMGNLPGANAPVTGDAGATPNELASRARDIASGGMEQARRLTATTRDRVMRTADEKKSLLTGKLDELARNIDEFGEKAGGEDDVARQLVDGASRTLRNVQHALDTRSTEELIDEVGRQIRQRPGLFLASCFAVGFIGARLLRK